MNASSARNKADGKIRDGVNGKMSNMLRTLTLSWGLDISGSSKDQVLIMDEVDGMGGELSAPMEIDVKSL